jgi:hypothetical protein
MLISTFSRMKRYSPAIEAAIDHCWPDHPAMYFISDCELPRAEQRQLLLRDSCWTEVLLHGLLAVRQRHPGLDYVFLMLDDHCPLRRCDTGAISAYLEIARSRNLVVVSFPTYDWPWERTECVDYPDGLVRTWRLIDVEVVNGRRLAIVPRDFFRYFQVQPAFWKIEYLIEACRTALAGGIRDPWAFETMRVDNASQHYMADYNWPNVHHGFIAEGKINPVAVSYMSRTLAAELHKQLLRDSIGVNSPALYGVYRLTSKGWNRFRGIGYALTARLQSRLSH